MINIGEAEYSQIRERLDLLWDLIENPIEGNTPNIVELYKLSNIANSYENHQIWTKYKQKFWTVLFEDLKE